MRVLVLGGTHHVGRSVVEAALRRGDEVTTVNRGTTPPRPDVDARYADRREPGSLAEALAGDTWDAVWDTWAQEPVVVQDAARLLDGRARHFTYVSSRSVYTWPIAPGANESAPVVDADPAGTDPDDYPVAKRGGELAVGEGFSGEILFARAGLILGPYEIVGRMPWWLHRVRRGGVVPAPGPPDRGLQYIDARDLAEWGLRCSEAGTTGTFDTVSRPGHATMAELLAVCRAVTGSDAELAWLTPEQVDAAGVSGWTDFPIWSPPSGEMAGLHDGDTSAAHAAGLTCRSIEETVTDTWAWLQAEGLPPRPPGREGDLGLSDEQEAALLAQRA
jgi:nucleoside-diphosphate-sugar epimerase